MSRNRDDDEHKKENSERWLLTYSDMITLLLVLFIMMYTISKVDVQKFDALAESLGIVMNPSTKAAASGSTGSDASESDGSFSFEQYAMAAATQDADATPSPTAAVSFNDDQLLSKIQSLITKDGLSDYVSVHSEERGIIVSLVEGLLFPSGSANINKEAVSTLEDLANVIKSVDNFIRVEGSTDNVPIHSAQYESNWELASQRAINVAKLMIDQGVDASRISAVSYGE
jgi:chemotaxis protein MotB